MHVVCWLLVPRFEDLLGPCRIVTGYLSSINISINLTLGYISQLLDVLVLKVDNIMYCNYRDIHLDMVIEILVVSPPSIVSINLLYGTKQTLPAFAFAKTLRRKFWLHHCAEKCCSKRDYTTWKKWGHGFGVTMVKFG